MIKLVAGTRRSELARIQTATVIRKLQEAFPDISIEEKIIVTKGDHILDSPLSKIGDKGLFTREIELELLDGSIDFAVHSLKDLPTDLPEGLSLGAVLERDSTDDVLISANGESLRNLRKDARVGTSSLRRQAQLKRLRNDIEILDIRGNVNTRIEKLERGDYDAIILARAGLDRMGLSDKISHTLNSDEWFYAVGQGAIAVEIRDGNNNLTELMSRINHQETRMVTDAERAFLKELGGGCQVPVGVISKVKDGILTISGMVSGIDGEPFLTGHVEGSLVEASVIGKRLAEVLLKAGACEILASIRECD